MSNTITYDAKEYNVHSVTVFQVDSAEVTRRIEVDLKRGQNEIIVKNLPTVLDGDSIRVDGIGKAIVFDVVYKAPSWVELPYVPRKSESPETEDLLKRKDGLTREQEVVESQRSILDAYSKTVSSEFAKADDLSNFLNTYGARQLEFTSKLRDLAEQVKKLDDEIRRAREAQGKLAGDNKLGARIVVIVLAGEDGPAELSLTYNVNGASWKPVYDLRAEITASDPEDRINSSQLKGNAGKESKSKITLEYRASISQKTAEDWTNVHLSLSTASPQLGSTIPTLSAMRLSEKADVYFGKAPLAVKKAKRASLSLGAGGVTVSSQFDGSAPGGPLPPPAPPQAMVAMQELPAFIEHARATVSNHGEGFSSAFVVDGLSNIPSDTDDSNESHKVTISVVYLQNVDLEWVTVPKESQSVFLKAKVRNTSEFAFLSGNASIFMNNNFVSKSNISHVSPLESFSVSLGVDPSVRVTYHPQSKKINNPTGGLLSTSRVSTVYQQNISIKNTRSLPLSRLIVKDQVPISTNAQIKVNVLEPDLPELQSGMNKTGSEASSSTALKEAFIAGNKDLRARWIRANEDEGSLAAAEGGGGEANTEGMVEWICRVEANSSLDLKLGWEVNVPKGFKWEQF